MTASLYIVKLVPYVITAATRKDSVSDPLSFVVIGQRVIPQILVNDTAILVIADGSGNRIITSRVISAQEDGDTITFETRNTHYELKRDVAE